MAEESADFLKKLLKTGIIGMEWPKKAYLFAVIKNRSGEVIWTKKYQTKPRRDSSNQNHAESQMLKDQEFKKVIEELYSRYKTKEVDRRTLEVDLILTINYSPCKECADDLIKILIKNDEKESPVRKLTIRFSHPYGTKDDREGHLDSLKDLDGAGITLEAMTEESWRDVMMTDQSWFDAMKDAKSSMDKEHWFDEVMKLFGLDPVKVRDRDDATRAKLAELLRVYSDSKGLNDEFETLRVSSASDSET